MIVVVGEALVDIVIDAEGDRAETPGGSPLNVAVGLARLEVPATLISQLGHDEYGGLVIAHVTASEAEIVTVPTTTGRTSVALARLDRTGVATYEFDLEWTLPPTELPACHALHVGSLGATLEPGRASVLDLVDQAAERGLFISYDANLRESFLTDRDAAWRDVRDLGARSTLVKLSDEDADLLAPDLGPDEVARALLAGERTELVVLTRGSAGATAFTATDEVSVTPRPVEVIDTVGAGDAFMAGMLAQLFDLGSFSGSPTTSGQPLSTEPAALERLLRGAAEIAAITCERRGANPPRRQELPSGWPA